MKSLIAAFRMILAMTLLTGIIYPLAMFGASQLLFPYEANGSLVYHDGKLIGSDLIAQKFTAPEYFWPRPSAVDYNPLPSSGTNLAPTSQALLDQITARRAVQDSLQPGVKPPDEMLLASGSGLDPHISPESAEYQIDRVARARDLSPEQLAHLQQLVKNSIEPYSAGFIGKPRINVLKLNISVDSLFSIQSK